eukprot:Skav205702  [mRNA]  locus=scaffold4631:33908:35092:- [translate_table: standard]
MAVVWTCEHFDNVDLWVDSQCTVDLVDKCRHAAVAEQLAHHNHWDLVRRLWTAVTHSSHRVHKLKAHSEMDPSLSLLELYRALGNKLANDVAIHACWSLNPGLAALCKEIHHCQQRTHDALHETYLYLLECQARRSSLETQERLQDPVEHQTTVNRRQQHIADLSGYAIPEMWPIPELRVNLTHFTAWGKTIGDSVVSWLRKLQWPTSEDQHTHQNWGVTWLELVLSWMLDTQLWLPVKRVSADGQERLVPLASAAEAQAYDVKFSELAHTMSKLVLQIETLLAPSLIPPIPRAQVKSLYYLGARYWQAGFAWRPHFPCQGQVVTMMESCIKIQQGRNFDRLPRDLFITTTADQIQRLQRELATPWDTSLNRCHEKARLVRSFMKQGQRQINFG